MFIYMITAGDKKYIGFDSHPVYMKKRWKTHCNHAISGSKLLVHQEMNRLGIENCVYEVLEDGFDSILDLAVAEIKYIKKFDTKNNGLNSTHGGDGIGTHNLTKLSKEDLELVLTQLSNSLSDYNNEVKWAGKTVEDRREMMKHLYTPEVIEKRVQTQLRYYESNPEIKKEKYSAIKKWRDDNPQALKEQNRRSGAIGAKTVSKKVKIILPCGLEKIYESKSAFTKEHGYIINNILDRTKQGLTHKGYQGWEINE